MGKKISIALWIVYCIVILLCFIFAIVAVLGGDKISSIQLSVWGFGGIVCICLNVLLEIKEMLERKR